MKLYVIIVFMLPNKHIACYMLFGESHGGSSLDTHQNDCPTVLD